MLVGDRSNSSNLAQPKESFKGNVSPRRAEVGKSAAIVGIGKLEKGELEMAEGNEMKKSQASGLSVSAVQAASVHGQKMTITDSNKVQSDMTAPLLNPLEMDE